jgi:hypothetical protein
MAKCKHHVQICTLIPGVVDVHLNLRLFPAE